MSWLHKSVASSTLEVIPDDGDANVFFVYPTAVSPLEDGLGPTRTIDTVVEGTAILTLASPKQVKGLQVSLVSWHRRMRPTWGHTCIDLRHCLL